MITHMTTHENTRSRHLDILAHHRSSQRAAISTAKRLPARRPSGHGYESEHYSRDATALWRRVGKLNTTLTDNSLILSDEFQSAVADWNIDFADYDEDAQPRELFAVQSKATARHKSEIGRASCRERVCQYV